MEDYRRLDPVPKDFEKFLKNEDIRNLLFLDFDGVFNPYSFSETFKKSFFNPDEKSFFRHISIDSRTGFKKKVNYEIRWSKELISSFNTLLSSEFNQVIWLSTWREDAGWIVDELGFSTLRPHLYLPWTEFSDRFQSGKIQALSSILSNIPKDILEVLKVVWVDDVAVPFYNKCLEWGDPKVSEYLNNENFLTVGPDSRYGLSRSEMDQILAFFR